MVKPVNKTLRIAAMSAGEEIGHVSGSIVTFRGNGDPLRSLLVNIDPVQDLHGYDNPWPAGGGKNLCLPYTERTSHFDVEYTVTENGVRVHGTATDASYSWSNAYNTYETALIHLPAGTYTFSTSALPTNNQATSYLVFNSKTEGGTARQVTLSGNTLSRSATFSESVGIYYGFYVASGQTVDCDCKIMIEAGGTETTFSPYSNICPISGRSAVNVWVKPAYDPTANPTATIQLGQTVYGGTLDVTNGVLTVDRAMVDLGTLTWQYVLDDVFFTSALYGIKKPGINNYINSTYGFSDASFANMPDKTMKGNTTAGGMYVKDSAFGQNPNTAKTGLSGVQLCYELATPITIPLTPQEISTLQGANNLWADSGDSDVEYIATGGEGGKLALLLRNRKELLIALRKGLTPAEAGLLSSTPLLGGFVRPGLSTDDEKEEDELW